MESTKQQIINSVFYKFKTKIEWEDEKWKIVRDNFEQQHNLFNEIIIYILKITDWYRDTKTWVESDIRYKFPDQKFVVKEEADHIQVILNSKPTDLKIYQWHDDHRSYFETVITPPNEGCT